MIDSLRARVMVPAFVLAACTPTTPEPSPSATPPELRDASVAPGKVTRHGVGWQAMCED